MYNLAALYTLLTVLPSLVLSSSFGGPRSRPHGQIAKSRRAVPIDASDVATFLDAHNSIRARHNAAPLTWSVSLATQAAWWADLCLFEQSNGILLDHPYGESIVGATGDYSIRDAVGTLSATREKYDPRTEFSQFTQIIWQSTTELGCAISKCDNIIDRPVTLYVCLYDPAGNVVGQLRQNVDLGSPGRFRRP